MECAPDPNSLQYALRVALQTMKERCMALQKRVTSLEEELQQQRSTGNDTKMAANKLNSGAAENLQLRFQVAELQRQKSQLNEHIQMISQENRNLWSRLSEVAKEQDSQNMANQQNNCSSGMAQQTQQQQQHAANQNLIRSKTFTQHSPNPNLRHRLITADIAENMEDLSLNEQELAGLNVYAATTPAVDDSFAKTNNIELDFAYLADNDELDTTHDVNFSAEATTCFAGLQEMRREAMRQQKELNAALTLLESKISLQPCQSCMHQSAKPEMADKSLETDESLNAKEIMFFNSNAANANAGASVEAAPAIDHINFIQEKIAADALDKTCPMCGRIFGQQISFDAFRQHVEMHFTDDQEVEQSLLSNYEFISHTVGDF